MPSRDGRTPSFCSERMKICQKHLSKVYSRSKNLLTSARAGKAVPAVSSSAARGYADGSNNPKDEDGLSEFEKNKLSPYLNAVAGLFDGPSLLKQFQLKKLRTQVSDRHFKKQSVPDCPQSCNKSQDPAFVRLQFQDNPHLQALTPPLRQCTDLQCSTKLGTVCAKCTGAVELWSDCHGYIVPTLSRDSNSKTRSSIPEKRTPGWQDNCDQLLEGGGGILPSNYWTHGIGKWKIPPHLSGTTLEKWAHSKLVVPQAEFAVQQQVNSESIMYKNSDKGNGNQRQSPPGSYQEQRALSTVSARDSSLLLPTTESQQQAVALKGERSLARKAIDTDSHQRGVSAISALGAADSQKRTRASLSMRCPPQLPSAIDSQHRNASTMSARSPSHLCVGPDSHFRDVSSKRGSNYSQPGMELQQGSSFTSIPKSSSYLLELQQREVSNATQRSFSQPVPDTDSMQKSVSAQVESQPGTFASRLTKKAPKSGNILQASVANFFGTSTGLPKPLSTLSVSQLNDAICDHSSPDCPNFKKDQFGLRTQIVNPALLQPTQSLSEDDSPQADALATGSIDEFAPSNQEVVIANETKYAFEVRTDMRRQEKSSANLWKYGSMAICIDNPGRDYTTGESPPDAWELMERDKYELGGIHWSKSGSRKVVNHVCQILKQGKWGTGVIELLDAVKGNMTTHCVNAILQQQKDPELCLAFFNWAQHQKGYKHDVFSFTTMINILGRARNLRGVRRLLEDMHAGGIEPTIATYNTLILCYGKVESLNESLRVFRIMQEAGCKPDNVTYSILIHLCIKAGYLEDSLKLYQSMLEAGVQPDTITYSIVIDSLGKSGNLREARKLFREMKDRRCIPNEFTYNSIIHRHAKGRKTQHALKYYTEMRGAGFNPNAVTCTTMMSVMGTLGKFEQAEGLFFEMQQAGIVADTAAYSLMINMWGNSGNLDKAVGWYGRMLGNLVTPSLSVFSSLVNAHLEGNLYQAAQHFLTSMGMWGINPDLKLYTILLRHCTVCETQEHADAVLGIMDRLGHPAHRFLFELLTSKYQDKQATRSRVESYFDSLEHEDEDNKQGFANTLIDFLHKLQCKIDPGVVWEIALEKGLFPSAILRREAPNHWLVDLHSMSIATAVVALPKLLVMLRDNWIQHPTKRVYVVTGWGKRSRVTGASALKQAVNDMLDATKSPFSLDHTNAGVFVSYGPPFRDWISQPSIIKNLLLASTGVVE